MKGISYIVFNESQIREIIGDAIASIGCRIMRSDNFHSYDINFDDSNGLVIESIIRTVSLEEIGNQEIENLSLMELLLLYKKQKREVVYCNLTEEKIKFLILEELDTWKRTAKLVEMPYIKIKFNGKLNENLTCLIMASKREIDPIVEQKILETKHEFADDINLLEIKKYQC